MTQTIGFLITFPLTGLDASIRMRVRPSIATSAPARRVSKDVLSKLFHLDHSATEADFETQLSNGLGSYPAARQRWNPARIQWEAFEIVSLDAKYLGPQPGHLIQ